MTVKFLVEQVLMLVFCLFCAVCMLDWCNPGFLGETVAWRIGWGVGGGLVVQPRVPIAVVDPAGSPFPAGASSSLCTPRCPDPCGGVGGVQAVEIGTDFLSSSLLFTSKGFCLSSLGCIHFPSLLLQFTALCWCLYFYFSDLPKMYLDFGISGSFKLCTLY